MRNRERRRPKTFEQLERRQCLSCPGLVTPHDTIPDFGCDPTIESLRSGRWGDPTTWSLDRVPTSDDVVLVSSGTAVVIEGENFGGTAYANVVAISGDLRFDPNTELRVTTVLVYVGGQLKIGTSSQPIVGHAEIVFRDAPLDLAADPGQFGHGLIVLGSIDIHGQPQTDTFVRLAEAPAAGSSVIHLSVPVAWSVGSEIVLPDSRQVRTGPADASLRTWPGSQTETRRIAAVDGLDIILDQPLSYSHPGNGNHQSHVGLLSRSVVLRSENPNGVRGHTMYVDRVLADIEYAEFRDLGRTMAMVPLDAATNHIGRYPLHMHHVYGDPAGDESGYQFRVVGNSIVGSPKWGVTIHDSHFGLVADNVLLRALGSGVMTEDGSESYNVIDHNFAIDSFGSGQALYKRSPIGDFGYEGTGFWFRGTNNYVRNNVAAASSTSLYVYAVIDVGVDDGEPDTRYPIFPGASTVIAGEFVTVNPNAQGILEFANNEGYGGAFSSGLHLWEVGAAQKIGGEQIHFYDGPASVVSSLTLWNMGGKIGVELRWSAHILVSGLVFHQQPTTKLSQVAVGALRPTLDAMSVDSDLLYVLPGL